MICIKNVGPYEGLASLGVINIFTRVIDPARTLIVEHDRDFMEVVTGLLAPDPTSALPVKRAADGGEAIGWLDRGLVPHLVLLDLERERLRAVEVLQRLRADPCYQHTAVVVAGAGACDPASRQSWLPREVWLSKPCDLDDRATAVALALSRPVGASPRAALARGEA